MSEEEKAELQEANDEIVWWHNRFNAVQRDYENLQHKIDKAIECIKNRNTTKSKKERFMSGKTTLEKVLEILGDKENGQE